MQNLYSVAVHLHVEPTIHLLTRPQRIRITVASLGQVAAYQIVGPHELAHRAMSNLSKPVVDNDDALFAATVRALTSLKPQHSNPYQKQHRAYIAALGEAIAIRNGMGQKSFQDEQDDAEEEAEAPIKLPITISTTSKELIEAGEYLMTDRPPSDSDEIFSALRKQLRRFDVHWRLSKPANPAIGRLTAWAKWAVTACAKPPLPSLSRGRTPGGGEVVRGGGRVACLRPRDQPFGQLLSYFSNLPGTELSSSPNALPVGFKFSLVFL